MWRREGAKRLQAFHEAAGDLALDRAAERADLPAEQHAVGVRIEHAVDEPVGEQFAVNFDDQVGVSLVARDDQPPLLRFGAVEQFLFERGGLEVNGLGADENGLRGTERFGGRLLRGDALRILSCARRGMLKSVQKIAMISGDR